MTARSRDAPHAAELDTALIRRRCGVTQRVFASWLDISERTLQRWERGKSSPRGLAAEWLLEAKRRQDEAAARRRTLAERGFENEPGRN